MEIRLCRGRSRKYGNRNIKLSVTYEQPARSRLCPPRTRRLTLLVFSILLVFVLSAGVGREGEKILSFTRDPRATPRPVAKAGSLSPLKRTEY